MCDPKYNIFLTLNCIFQNTNFLVFVIVTPICFVFLLNLVFEVVELILTDLSSSQNEFVCKHILDGTVVIERGVS